MLPRRARLARGHLNCPLTGDIRGPKGSGSRAPESRNAARRGRGLEEVGAPLEVGGAGARLPAAGGVPPSLPIPPGGLRAPFSQYRALRSCRTPGTGEQATLINSPGLNNGQGWGALLEAPGWADLVCFLQSGPGSEALRPVETCGGMVRLTSSIKACIFIAPGS